MIRGPKETIALDAAIDQAESSATLVTQTVEEFSKASEAVLAVSEQVADASSETIAGVIGTGVGLGASAVCLAALPVGMAVAPLVLIAGGIVGLGTGVLALRGRRSVERERHLREEAMRLKSVSGQAELLRKEIEQARLANAPPEVVKDLWLAYGRLVGSVEHGAADAGQQLLPAKRNQLLLPGPRVETEGG